MSGAVNLPTIERHGLSAGSVPERPNHVRIAGVGDTLGAPVLDGFLRELHEQLLANGVAQVTVELDQLSFINSSCLKAMVSWIHKVDTSGRPYRIRLMRALAMRWQKNSLATLQRLAPSIVTVEDSA